ncbi:sigma-70 family RNA polymerase sigma factor [Chitinophaga sp. 30R24]|uniref:sigma-70 family RNA polymerase sigma factor n=1 Tax=Chitinophaga sp. 30R24 TaxID=3248838 RepID=UPI003B8FE048
MNEIILSENNTDNELIHKVLAGDTRQYEQLMRRYNASLFRIGMAMLNNDADVEDAMQTTYINAYKHLGSFRQESAFGTWLKRIMINECSLQLKHRSKVRAGDIALTDEPDTELKASPEAKVIDKELGAVLEQALLQVPEKYRVVFVMREMEQLSNAETAAVLNISPVNVKVRLLRAKIVLRGKIAAYYNNDLVFPFHLIRCDRVVNKVLLALDIQ